MSTNLSYVRSLAPETPGWVHEQIAWELDRRDAELEDLRKYAATVEAERDEAQANLTSRRTELEHTYSEIERLWNLVEEAFTEGWYGRGLPRDGTIGVTEDWELSETRSALGKENEE